jgi:hypothetical protein
MDDWRTAGGQMDERAEWLAARDVDPRGEDDLLTALDDAREDARAEGQRTGVNRIPPGFFDGRVP